MTFEELKARREAILAIARRYGARDLRIFGSVVRGEADAQSDVDFLRMRVRNNAIMNVSIPPEFEAFAREQVAAGRFASEADVVADALRQYLADRDALLALLDPAIEQLDRGEGRPFDAVGTKRRGRKRRRRASACPE